MVNNTLPLPILKYVEMTPAQLDKIITEYPFYILPKVARALIINKNEGKSIEDFNFFGFEPAKFNEYSQIFNSENFKIEKSESKSSDVIQDNVTDENALSLHDIIVQIQESNPEKNINSTHIISDLNETDENRELESNQVKENSKYQAIVKDEISKEDISLFELIANIHDKKDENIEKTNSDFHTEDVANFPEKTEIEEFIENNEINESQSETSKSNTNIESELTVKALNSDINYLELDSVHFEPAFNHNLVETIQFENENNSTSKRIIEEPIQIELSNQKNEASDIEQDSTLQYVYIDKIIEYTDIDISSQINKIESNEKTQIIEFESKKIEDKIDFKEEEAKVEVIKEENETIEKAIHNIESAKIEEFESSPHDFSSWLNNFKNSTQPNLTLVQNQAKIETTTDELDHNLAISHIEHTLLEEIEPKNELEPKINLAKDDELEGVLKDSFYLNQIETKKESQKTPAINRIQDNALQSLISIDIISETIAILYAQQGNIVKAIEVYEKLIQKFPEKSGFFATQIENLKK